MWDWRAGYGWVERPDDEPEQVETEQEGDAA